MNSTTPLQTLKYSAFLGGIFASDEATEAKINEAINAVGGETVRKKGFSGSGPDSPSAKALAILKDAGITPIRMKGPLTSVKVTERTVNGAPANYLNVTLGTLAGKQFLSIDMTNKAAQDLVRRLTDAEPAIETEISLYATYGQREGASRAYADHHASVKQNDKALRGTNPADMWPAINAKKDALKSAGISDKAMLQAVANKVALQFHLDLIPVIRTKIAAYYEQRPVAPVATTAQPAAPVVAAAPAVTPEDDDPFGLNEPEMPVAAPPTAMPRVADPFAL